MQIVAKQYDQSLAKLTLSSVIWLAPWKAFLVKMQYNGDERNSLICFRVVQNGFWKNGLVLKTEPFLKTQGLGGKNCAQKLERVLYKEESLDRERTWKFELKVVREW